MASFYLYLFGTTIMAWLLWTCVSLLINYNIACRMGYPMVISPVHPLNLVWILMRRAFLVNPTAPNLPSGLGKWTRCSHLAWMFHDKYALHEELGKIFVLVTPNGNEMIVADPEVAYYMMSRRKEFVKPIMMYKPLEAFGRNVDSVEGDDWQRHRRVTAPSFNEKLSSLVWTEAQRQADDMLQAWLNMGPAGTTDTVEDTAKLALHVLTFAGFGISHQFHEDDQELAPGHSMTFVYALTFLLRNFTALTIVPRKYLRSRMMPSRLWKLGQAAQDFKRYMEEMVENERGQISKYKPGEGNLVTVLVRASEDARQSSKPALAFTDDEIFGNIFVYALAGHESTANTINYALVLLAAHPDCQEWLADEIDHVLGKYGSPEEQNYEGIFPRLKRCLALMFETIRVYGPVLFLPKTTGLHHQTLVEDGKGSIIPPKTGIYINVQSLHTDPSLWGSDSLIWRPERWLIPPRSESGGIDEETLMQQRPGKFIPWAEGPRNCPGKKFSQVEFVGVMTTLFRKHRVRPVLRQGESTEDARKTLIQMAEDSALTTITVQMRHPKRVGLRWVRKDEE